MNMRFQWDETKRARNLKAQSLDFLDAPDVLGGLTFPSRTNGSLGFPAGIPVSIVHTESNHEIRRAAFRDAAL